MAKRGRFKRFRDDWSDRAMVAYACGARLAAGHPDEVITYQQLGLDDESLLTAVEQDARRFLMPATWEQRFWQGWHDALDALDDDGETS